MSFGQWYEQQKQQETSGGSNGSLSPFNISGSLFGGTAANANDGDEDTGDSSGMLPLFSSGSGSHDFSFSGMKQSLEQQFPSKILGMNYQQRFRMFCVLLLLSALFFGLGFAVGLPLITIRPQKFALCFTFGSLTFMSSFAILRGPAAHISGMLAMDRLPFTTIYLSSMFCTLYFCFSVGGISGYVTVIASSVLQILALLWYLITFIPGGSAGMHVLFSAMIKISKPVIVGCTKVWAACVAKLFGWVTG